MEWDEDDGEGIELNAEGRLEVCVPVDLGVVFDEAAVWDGQSVCCDRYERVLREVDDGSMVQVGIYCEEHGFKLQQDLWLEYTLGDILG